MDNQYVTVRELLSIGGLFRVCGDDKSLDRIIVAPDINRPGLELSGYYQSNELKRVIILGNKECGYISNLDVETQRERFNFLTDEGTPCIVITNRHECPEELKKIAQKKNFPIFSFHGQTYQITADIVSFLSEKLAPRDSVHGVMMSIYGVGVMITGDSGIGKSELALDLIKRGHMLVADDIVEVARVHNDTLCQAPDILKRMLEVRGLGIIDVNLMFGENSYLEKAKLDLVIHLVKSENYNELDRLNPSEKKIKYFGVEEPLLEIPVTLGKSMSVIIESAVTNQLLKNRGINTTDDFKKRVFDAIQIKNMKGEE